MSLLDLITGGKNDDAEKALQQAMAAYQGIQAPTQAQLTLPQLQQYVNAGIMTPAEAQAYLQQTNAYAQENIDQGGTQAMQQALGELSSIADSGPMGTPVQQAQAAQNIQQLNNAVQGQRGAIEQQMEAKGTPAALIQAALQNQYVGQDAQQAYQNSLNQQAAAYQAAVQALSEKANVGSALQGMQNTQANTVAQAQNAMQQFNAANQQQASALNAQLKQQANQYNTQNAQNVANQNVQQNNARTAYNTNVPQQVFENQMNKAAGQAGVNQKQADLYQQQGQQQAGLLSGLIGAGATLGGDYLMGNAIANQMPGTTVKTMAHGGMVGSHEGCYHDGGICMEGGGMVPGHAKVPGDSERNDIVHAQLSPGEAVIPRTAVQAHMPEVLGLISGQGHGLPPPGAAPAHPHDVASVLQALREIRMGAHHV